jgi:hypothetical protein
MSEATIKVRRQALRDIGVDPKTINALVGIGEVVDGELDLLRERVKALASRVAELEDRERARAANE